MKFDHRFTLFHADNNTRIYKCDDVSMRIDFIRDMFKVSLIRNEDLLPTFSINPDRRDLPGDRGLQSGREEKPDPGILYDPGQTHEMDSFGSGNLRGGRYGSAGGDSKLNGILRHFRCQYTGKSGWD